MQVDEMVWREHLQSGQPFADLIDDCEDMPDYIDLEHTEEWERCFSHVAN